MIRAHFGIDINPFSRENVTLLPQQQEIFDTLRVHSQQGGLCLVLGEPGTGKSIIKEKFRDHAPDRIVAPCVARTLHSYRNTVKILCQAFNVDAEKGMEAKNEYDLINEATRLNQLGRMIAPIIDDAHLMDIQCLRKIRLLFEDFPKNHNLILVAQPSLLTSINLIVNEDIRSRVTHSAIIKKLNPDHAKEFILSQLDRCKLPHNTFSEDAIALIVRSADGVLRNIRNICLNAMLEALRAQSKTVGKKQVNKVLMQPHWSYDYELEEK